MESAEYRTMFSLESDYWWFKGLHRLLIAQLAAHLPRPSTGRALDLLDAGCGTGGLMQQLRLANPAWQVYGLDVSSDAAPFWRERQLHGRVTQASINELPFAEGRFSAVMSVDILEVEGVDDKRAYAELVRVTASGGLVVLVVPAYQWMMTKGHHQAVHAVRRYNRASVLALTEGLPMDILRLTHVFAGVFPLVAGRRLMYRVQERLGPVAVKSELKPLPALLNQSLLGVMDIERRALGRINMPFGSSLLLIARKR